MAVPTVRPAGKSGLFSLMSTRQVLTSPPVLVKSMAGLTGTPAISVLSIASASTGASTASSGRSITVMAIAAVEEPSSFSAMTVTTTAPALASVGVPVISQVALPLTVTICAEIPGGGVD